MEPAISIHNLSKRYKLQKTAPYVALRDVISNSFKSTFSKQNKTELFWALQNIRFDVMAGERVGIIGRNGAGKSTLLKIISRITPPTKGKAVINGRVGSLLEVGTGFHPELTGRENIYLNGSILGLRRTEINQHFDEIISFSGVEKFIDTPLKHYSSGMQLRLAFSVAAHLNPEILLIDEVLAVGDIEFQKKCIGKMEEVSKREGRTILFVSHNLSAIRNLCNRCIYLDKGQIRADGATGSIVDQYIGDNLKTTSHSINLSDKERFSNKPGHAKIVSISFNGGSAITHHSPVKITMEIEADQPINNTVAAIGFVTVEGSQVLLLDTDNSLEDKVIFPLKMGTNLVDIMLDYCDLQPGTYFINAALRSNNAEQVYDLIRNCMVVNIVPGENTPAVFADTSYQGGVRPPVRWKINQL